MNRWEHITNAALLGTGNKTVESSEMLPEYMGMEELQPVLNTLDNEDRFLVVAALANNYRRCGVMPFRHVGNDLMAAPDEDLPYCSIEAIKTLNLVLEKDVVSLMELWLQLCREKGFIVKPEIITTLLEWATKNKKYGTLVIGCCGKRGEWLAMLNNDWEKLYKPQEEDVWQNGTINERKEALTAIRAVDAAKGREMLMATWDVENAVTRTELLKPMALNISDADLFWLNIAMNDKSQKVKDEVLRLMKQFPSSTIIIQYQQIISKSVRIKQEKGFLGIGSKWLFQVDPPIVEDENIFKSGIEKLSKDPWIGDNDYILLQLISEVPPNWWESHLNSTPDKVVKYFQSDDRYKKYVKGLVAAVVKFRDKKWAVEIAHHAELFYQELLPLLNWQEQEKLLFKHFTDAKGLMENGAVIDSWSLPFAKKVLEYVKDKITQRLNGNYATNNFNNCSNKVYYNENIMRIPLSVLSLLDSVPPKQNEDDATKEQKDALQSWENTDGYLVKLLQLKQNIYKTFE